MSGPIPVGVQSAIKAIQQMVRDAGADMALAAAALDDRGLRLLAVELLNNQEERGRSLNQWIGEIAVEYGYDSTQVP